MRVITLCAIVLLASPAGAQKTSDVTARGWPLDADGMVRIHNHNGSITVTGWDRDSVAVSAVIAGKASLFGGGGRRGVKLGIEGNDGAAAPAAELAVFVPARARLSVLGAATWIEIRNFAGAVDASTLSGRIRITGPTAEIIAETMDGDLEIEASPAYLRGKTATGRITWTGSSDDVSLHSVSGTVTVAASTLLRARIESVSGDIKFTGAVKAGGHAGFESHGGDVTLGFLAGTVADLTVDAPTARVLGRTTARAPGKSGPIQLGIPRGVTRTAIPADITARSFKGQVTITQP